MRMPGRILGAVLAATLASGWCVGAETNLLWKAGVAAVKITPTTNMWMAGYAARKKPSDGVTQDLFAKALALEAGNGARLVIVTADLIGIPRALRDNVEHQVRAKYNLPPAGLLMNASHTHSGPVLRVKRAEAYAAFEPERSAETGQYADELEQKLVALIGQAIGRLAPARLDYLRARCGFAMNRRRPTPKGYANAPNPDGPVDHDVPVLRVTGPDGKELRALLFGYACHNTTLGLYEFCGDYAGYAQEYLEKAHPGTTALFMIGCAGDQNPYPRRTLELARQHGRSLATAVEAALETEPRAIRSRLGAALEEVSLDFAPAPPRQELERLAAKGKGMESSHAKRLLKQLDETGAIKTTYPYPVQVVSFGNDLLLVALAGEAVVDYSLRLKRELAGPAAVWVAGYSNDVFGYVPSRRVLQEGGYEAGDAMLFTSLPGPFAPSVEERIVSEVSKLVRVVSRSK